MKTSRAVTVGALLGFFLAAAAQAQTFTWYRFRKTFINSAYQDGVAFGSVRATTWKAAATIHPTSCGGKDGELHIGAFDSGLDTTSTGGNPPSAPLGSDSDWGLVAELPDARAGDGPSGLDGIKTKPVTFTGFLRVWDEGHGAGQVFPSNPHHVPEIHPVWKFEGDGTSFEDRELIRAMAGYRGYGATKFKPHLKSLQDGEWPLAYQGADFLYVRLRKAENFYQLPVVVNSVSSISGGHEATVDVCSDRNFENRRYEGLRYLTVDGSEYDGEWETDTKCLEQSAGASDENSAVAVPQAAEFFVFGVATGTALATCN